MEFPIYKCVIDENLNSDLQVSYVALVDRPAIEKNFLAFNKEKLKFLVDTSKRIVSGPVMAANMLIYRNSPQIGEYYTVFDAPTIEMIVQKFFKKGYIQNFNIMHDDKATTGTGITIFESFLTNAERGIMPMKGFEDMAEGSWFISAKVDDDSVWSAVQDGTLRGFSVEGIFQQIPVKQTLMSEDSILKSIKALLDSCNLE